MSTRTLAAVAAVGLALGVGADGARAAFPGRNGRIAFAVQEWRRADPCLGIPHDCEPDFRADGRRVHRIVDAPSEDPPTRSGRG
jgi:hypothetical protein